MINAFQPAKTMDSLLYRLSFTLIPSRCLLCLAPAGRSMDLCSNCEGDLPIIDNPCRRCGLELSPPATICGACLASPPGFCRSFFALRYDWPVNALVNRFKHHGQMALGTMLAHLLATRYLATRHPCDPTPTQLIPVPLHRRRIRERGFNQAREIAEVLSARTGIPLAANLVNRVSNTPPQQGLNQQQRQVNLHKAFRVRRPLPPTHVALVDDVVTTMATVAALSRLLLAQGAHSVEVIALARTPRPARR